MSYICVSCGPLRSNVPKGQRMLVNETHREVVYQERRMTKEGAPVVVETIGHEAVTVEPVCDRHHRDIVVDARLPTKIVTVSAL